MIFFFLALKKINLNLEVGNLTFLIYEICLLYMKLFNRNIFSIFSLYLFPF